MPVTEEDVDEGEFLILVYADCRILNGFAIDPERPHEIAGQNVSAHHVIAERNVDDPPPVMTKSPRMSIIERSRLRSRLGERGQIASGHGRAPYDSPEMKTE
jgi:hypothetical protein